jgi:hypothetical protein
MLEVFLSEDEFFPLILHLYTEFLDFREQQNNDGNALLSCGQKAASRYFPIKFMKYKRVFPI